MSKWKVSRNYVCGEYSFNVYKIIDESRTDYSGNRETYGCYSSKEVAERVAAELNNK